MIELSIHVRVQQGKVAVFTRGGGVCVLGEHPARFKVPADGGLIVFPDAGSDSCYYISSRALLEGLREALAQQRANNQHPPALSIEKGDADAPR